MIEIVSKSGRKANWAEVGTALLVLGVLAVAAALINNGRAHQELNGKLNGRSPNFYYFPKKTRCSLST